MAGSAGRSWQGWVWVFVGAASAAASCTARNPRYRVDGGTDATAADLAPASDAGGTGGSGGAGGGAGVGGTAGEGGAPTGSPDDAGGEVANQGDAGADLGPVPDVASQPEPMLVGAWHFDDGPGNPTATDSSGAGAVGTLVGMDPNVSWVAGHNGGTALAFTPTATAPTPGVRLAPIPALAGLQRFTVAAWIYRTGTTKPAQMSISSQQLNGTIDEVFNLCIVNERLTLYLPSRTDGVGHAVNVSGSLPFGVWIHVAATFDGQVARLYRDGTQVGSAPYPYALPVSTDPIYIGTNINPTNQQPFVGDLDEVWLFNGALGAADIALLARP
jgi:hypothetical protein